MRGVGGLEGQVRLSLSLKVGFSDGCYYCWFETESCASKGFNEVCSKIWTFQFFEPNNLAIA